VEKGFIYTRLNVVQRGEGIYLLNFCYHLRISTEMNTNEKWLSSSMLKFLKLLKY